MRVYICNICIRFASLRENCGVSSWDALTVYVDTRTHCSHPQAYDRKDLAMVIFKFIAVNRDLLLAIVSALVCFVGCELFEPKNPVLVTDPIDVNRMCAMSRLFACIVFGIVVGLGLHLRGELLPGVSIDFQQKAEPSKATSKLQLRR